MQSVDHNDFHQFADEFQAVMQQKFDVVFRRAK